MSNKYFVIRNSRIAARLSEVTRFARIEIVALLRIYQQIEEVYGMPFKKNVFVDIMANLFDIHNDLIVGNMFFIANYSTTGCLSEEEWVFLMEIFLVGNFEDRLRFVFTVYDLEKLGELSRAVVTEFVSRCVTLTTPGEDQENIVKDVVDVMMATFDVKKNGTISFERYKEVCLQEPLYMECLGHCLPDQRHVLAMLALFESREKHDIYYYMKDEKPT